MKPSTKAVERDHCGAILHPLLHRSRTSHRCKCGYRTVWDPVARGECPECDEAIAFEGGDDMTPERLEEIQEEIEKEQFARDLMINLGLLQAAAILRAVPDGYTVREAVAQAKAIWQVLNDER